MPHDGIPAHPDRVILNHRMPEFIGYLRAQLLCNHGTLTAAQWDAGIDRWGTPDNDTK